MIYTGEFDLPTVFVLIFLGCHVLRIVVAVPGFDQKLFWVNSPFLSPFMESDKKLVVFANSH